jgi:twitching motility protein PilT
VNQREVGSNTHSFANALRGALREDPDVILVGEMRDLETISLALTAAETGHLVFGTLHTMNAPKTIDRVIDVFPPQQQQQIRVMFAEAVAAVISQVLLKKKDGTGRIAALEIMIATPAIKNLIREGKTHQISSIIQTSQRLGMQNMDQVLKSLAMSGKVDFAEAKMYAANPDLFDDRLSNK